MIELAVGRVRNLTCDKRRNLHESSNICAVPPRAFRSLRKDWQSLAHNADLSRPQLLCCLSSFLLSFANARDFMQEQRCCCWCFGSWRLSQILNTSTSFFTTVSVPSSCRHLKLWGITHVLDLVCLSFVSRSFFR